MSEIYGTKQNNPNRIIVHHTATPATEGQLLAIDRNHKERGFPKSELGYYVGYHYLIEPSGLMHKVRLESEFGAHDQGENINTLGVGLVGNFNGSLPTPAQERALGDWLVEKVRQYDLAAVDIEPHRRHDTTDCYGTSLPDEWAQYVYLRAEKRSYNKWMSWILLKLARSRRSAR